MTKADILTELESMKSRLAKESRHPENQEIHRGHARLAEIMKDNSDPEIASAVADVLNVAPAFKAVCDGHAPYVKPQ